MVSSFVTDGLNDLTFCKCMSQWLIEIRYSCEHKSLQPFRSLKLFDSSCTNYFNVAPGITDEQLKLNWHFIWW